MEENEFSGLSKKQRRELRKRQKYDKREERIRKKTTKKWIIRSIIVLLLIVAIYFLFIKKPDISGKGILRVSPDSYDFGSVSLRGGTVSAKIPLINIGEGDLTIKALDSSCGCTTASVINNGQEGPIFQMAMHGKNPRNWKTVIKPGEQAFLKVYYNPNVHPELRGPVTRVVTILSDDPLDNQQQVKIKVNQVD